MRGLPHLQVTDPDTRGNQLEEFVEFTRPQDSAPPDPDQLIQEILRYSPLLQLLQDDICRKSGSLDIQLMREISPGCFPDLFIKSSFVSASFRI